MDNIPDNTFGTGIGKRTIVNKAPMPKPTPEENKILINLYHKSSSEEQSCESF
jgi:hypothetical protein